MFINDYRYVPSLIVTTFYNRSGVLAIAAEALYKKELLDAKDRLYKNKSRLNTFKRISKYFLITLYKLTNDLIEKAKSTSKKKT